MDVQKYGKHSLPALNFLICFNCSYIVRCKPLQLYIYVTGLYKITLQCVENSCNEEGSIEENTSTS